MVEKHIERIEQVNPRLNAVVRDRFEPARLEAKQADARVREGGADLPPLIGVPCTIKESIALTGMPNSSGVVARASVIASSDATAVDRLRAAGAIPVGVTNTPEIPSYRPPAWINEGLAEWFEARAQGKRRLNHAEASTLSRAYGRGALFSLSSLSSPSFGHLGQNAAQIAYLEAYGMVDFLSKIRGEDSLREVCKELVRTHDLNRTIRRVFKVDLGQLEERFFDELG